ncbi:MAG: tagaturonate reductase [Bacteroidota bacterium]
MKELNLSAVEVTRTDPVKVVQFGEGNFLRAFVDWILDDLNNQGKLNGQVSIVQPIKEGLTDLINKQDGLYHVFTEGIVDGEQVEDIRLIKSVMNCIDPFESYQDYISLAEIDTLEFVVSNTTEAGIQFINEEMPEGKAARSFPGKLTQFLYQRYQYFNADIKKGLTILPCELIENNAGELKKCIFQHIDAWNLGDDFKGWLLNANSFHNTLVDRIVTGFPKGRIEEYQNKVGYNDNLIVTAEHYHLWVIEGTNNERLHQLFDDSNLNVLLVDDLQPYRTRKVRILNGAHTSMVPVGLLHGNSTVKQTVEASFTKQFVEDLLFNEVCPTLDFPEEVIKSYTEAILNRFKNPAIKHQLSSIALNSISKFRVRVLPSILEHESKYGKLPDNLVLAFAALIVFYKGKDMPVNDDRGIEAYFKGLWNKNSIEEIVKSVLENNDLWGRSLIDLPGLSDMLCRNINLIEEKGIEEAWIESCNNH